MIGITVQGANGKMVIEIEDEVYLCVIGEDGKQIDFNIPFPEFDSIYELVKTIKKQMGFS